MEEGKPSNFDSVFQSKTQTCEKGHTIYPCYERDLKEPCPVCTRNKKGE